MIQEPYDDQKDQKWPAIPFPPPHPTAERFSPTDVMQRRADHTAPIIGISRCQRLTATNDVESYSPRTHLLEQETMGDQHSTNGKAESTYEAVGQSASCN
jgi:hypothetical protein